MLFRSPGDRSHHQQLPLSLLAYAPAYLVGLHCLALSERKYLLASAMLSRNTLSCVASPRYVSYSGFSSADTVTVGIMACSFAENAESIKSLFSHSRKEHVSQVMSVYLVLYGSRSNAYLLISKTLPSFTSRTSHSISSLPLDVSLSCSYAPKKT